MTDQQMSDEGSVASRPSAPLLTDAEHTAVTAVADAWAAICKVVGNGPTRGADLGEVVIHVHALQHFVMAQAAARAYPDIYRLAGETLAATDHFAPPDQT